MTYLTPSTGRPSRETLSHALGFKVPSCFAAYICQLYDFTRGDPQACLDAFETTLGLCSPNGRDARYWGTPPELFPVGSTGCDGDHYGFLLHAPELDLDDLPYGHYCPMDSDGVIIVGSTAQQGIASVMAQHLCYDFINVEKKKLITDIARAGHFQPQEEENPAITLPNGWRFLPSSDGVGTLAPAELFAPQPVEQCDRYKSPAEFVKAADREANNGHLATALHYLREGLWFFWHAKPFTLARRMVEVYVLINRAELADELTHTMNRWSEAEER